MMRMKGIFAAALLISLAGVALAQQPAMEPVIVKHRVFQGPEGAPAPLPDGNFVFLASESFGGKIVKGAPYSAEAVTESIQTLSDGNRIVNRFSSSVYRDSEGRTRREHSLKGLGVLGVGEQPWQTIFIHDPVAGVTFSLDSRTHVAHKNAAFRFEVHTKDGPSVSAGRAETWEFKVAPSGATSHSNVIVTAPLAGTATATRVPHPGVEEFGFRTGSGAATYAFKTARGPNTNEKKEDLGRQIIEGVEAEGTRTTVTIPAGDIGNERPIEIVSERWYSPELQLMVMTRHSDPRTGETTYRLTNINRTEPARSLFEVPPDYTIKSGLHLTPAVPLPRKKSANPE